MSNLDFGVNRKDGTRRRTEMSIVTLPSLLCDHSLTMMQWVFLDRFSLRKRAPRDYFKLERARVELGKSGMSRWVFSLLSWKTHLQPRNGMFIRRVTWTGQPLVGLQMLRNIVPKNGTRVYKSRARVSATILWNTIISILLLEWHFALEACFGTWQCYW